MSETKFSPFLLKSILSLLYTDEEFREKFLPVLKLEYFNFGDKFLYILAQAAFRYVKMYDMFPSPEIVAEEIFKRKGQTLDLDVGLFSKEELDTLKEFFYSIIDEEVKDVKYIEQNLISIIQQLEVQKKVFLYKESLSNGTADLEKFAQEITNAVTLITPVQTGVNLLDDLQKRTYLRVNTKSTPGTVDLLIPSFAHYIEDGGLPPGSLGFFLAPTNGGKSIALVHTSFDAALHGHNVLYVSAELSEDLIKNRFDSCVTGIDSTKVKKNASIIYDKITKSSVFSRVMSRIQVIEVPDGEATVSDINAMVERLRKNGFDTNLLVVDYADNLKAEKRFEHDRAAFASIYKGLRALAKKQRIVCWTASQMNDEGTAASEKKSGVITVRHVNESRAKIHIADFSIAVARTQEEKDMNQARLVLLKNRLGPGDGAVVQVSTRFDISRLFGEEKNIIRLEDLPLSQPIKGMEELGSLDTLSNFDDGNVIYTAESLNKLYVK